jgi:hypothetical protein
MWGGNKYFGALHLARISIGFRYKYFAALPLPVGNEMYVRNK